MKHTKPTLTVGIPAYNEDANLKYLLEDLLRLDTRGFILKNIIVNSDGSTDKTVSIAREFNKKKIVVINNKQRHGLSKIQNQIFIKTNSDILVLLNADIMIKDKKFLKKLILPIIENKAELTCSNMEELKSSTFTGNILNFSMKFKTAVFEKYKNGNNIYTCRGTARAFSKKIYKKIEFKESIGEDAYSYLYTIFNKYRYKYINSTKAYYRLPTNFKDHERQSIRFLQSKNKFIKEFGKDFIKENYYIPTKLLAQTVIKYFIKNPIHMTSYIVIYYSLKLKSIFETKVNNQWEISKSSKNLRGKYI